MKNIAIGALLALLFLHLNANAQLNRTKMEGAYAYNFARYTFWPNETQLDSFRILLISSNNQRITEFNEFSKSLKVKGKPISLSVLNSLPKKLQAKTNLIFLGSDQSALFNELNNLIGELPILLVSDNVSNKQLVMINLYDTPKQELLFEVNKANIINRNLQIDPEILLLGGTEIDVAALYRTSQKEMGQLQQRLTNMNDSLLKLKTEITANLQQIKKQQLELQAQKELFDNQKKEIEQGKNEINRQENNLKEQKQEIEKQEEVIERQKESITKQTTELSDQLGRIEKQQSEIAQGKIELENLLLEIKNKNQVLNKQGTIISRQQQILLMAFISAVLFIVALVSVISGYRSKNRKNKILVQQKNEIEAINKKLSSTNKSLFQTLGQLKETQSQLVSAEKMASLGVLTAGIAHEINNPVNFIYTGINSLRKDIEELLPMLNYIDQLNEEDQEQIRKLMEMKRDIDFNDIIEIIPQTISDIKIGAERAADIIKGLRNFSRIDKDAMQYANVHEGIDSALLLLRNKFKNHIKIVKNYQQLPSIECYPGKLNQAFLNIIGNAIDAIETEGTISISTRCEPDHVEIEINDTGKGISKENIGKVFDPFFTTKSVGKGVGLGLSITFGIIQEHKGTIMVKSEENIGTSFTISLPCKLKNE